METQFQLTVNGQSILQADINTLGESALADDRMLADFLRLAPYAGGDVDKAIYPYTEAGDLNSTVCINARGNGSVDVRPFRAFVGSRAATGASVALNKVNWRDIRSGIWVGDGGATADGHSQWVVLAANATGNPRWDTVYAIVTPDYDSAPEIRRVKDPTTEVITPASLVTTLTTRVQVAVVTGTAGASPVLPTIPTDGAGSYYIALAHVYVPTGFGAASNVAVQSLAPVAPMQTISPATTGARTIRPANKNNVVDPTKWTGILHPATFLPTDTIGSESLIVQLDLSSASSANWSHATTGVVDDSRDWRNCLFKWTAFAVNIAVDATASFAAQYSPTPTPYALVPSFGYTSEAGVSCAVGGGQSFVAEATTNSIVAAITNATIAANKNMTGLPVDATILIYCDQADSGKLKVLISGTPRAKVVFFIEAFGPVASVNV